MSMEGAEEAGKGRILIVDDTTANIEILYQILKGEFDVLFAKSGADGIRMVREHSPDLVLLDIMMPDMDGYQVCRVLKQDPATAQIPVVFVTAMGNDEDETRGLEEGAIDYLTKPIRPAIVVARVRNHLELKHRGDLLEKLSSELTRKNAELEQLARQDGLTGVANRRHFDESLRSEIQRAARNGRNLSLIMCDIDHFKKFNDLYGHFAGDKCLQLVGELLRKSFKRAGEVVARYGGEEFAVILPDTSAELAGHLAERLRLELLAQALPHADSEFGMVTMSLGVAGVLVTREHDQEWFITCADDALYRSKAAGRNRVTVWDQ
ncbi:diguanylate cyclase [Geomonas paludis]|uniref:diguanylate cyclase n=1 Tax=Geomonas paludis TaxID=2740185 RepID=A0A6V8MYD3_9BACT|nr:diguanylate cyclase [Geomonas paludis]UPU37237.1 diguanylate cyclase [Geomonas paludis]GFO65131.1 diguanylate cyclase response regulator [Geomonas paludis]